MKQNKRGDLKKQIIEIKGMHCRSCEILVADELKKIDHVSKVNVNFRQKTAEIISSKPINQTEISRAVTKAGYEVGRDESKSLFSSDLSVYTNILFSMGILGVVYLIAKTTNFNLNFASAQTPSNLAVVLLVGLTAGVSTCMALVGGLVLGVSARFAEKHPEAKPAQKFRPHLFFNLGRIIAYALLGGMVGLVGSAFQLSGLSLGIITILVGLVMLVVGLQLTEVSPRISGGGITLPSGLAKLIGLKKRQDKEYSHANAMILGALTFFLPCGFTQAMQIYALSTGHFLSGALIMGTFALGTAPGLLGVGGLTSVMRGSFAKKFYVFAGVVVVALALINLSNGLHLAGIKLPKISAKTATDTSDANVVLTDGFQVIRMDQVASGYKPNHFTVKAGIPVRWIVNSKSQSTCASSLYSSELDIATNLKSGDNVFEFTPQKPGEIEFSCSMGMYQGYFEVTK